MVEHSNFSSQREKKTQELYLPLIEVWNLWRFNLVSCVRLQKITIILPSTILLLLTKPIKGKTMTTIKAYLLDTVNELTTRLIYYSAYLQKNVASKMCSQHIKLSEGVSWWCRDVSHYLPSLSLSLAPFWGRGDWCQIPGLGTWFMTLFQCSLEIIAHWVRGDLA